MQDKIIAAIAAYLEKETVIATKLVGGETTRHFMSNPAKLCQEIAAEIAAAIAPLLEAGEADWEAAPEWAEWRIFDEKNNVAYSHGFPSENTQMQVPKDFGTTHKVERRPQ